MKNEVLETKKRKTDSAENGVAVKRRKVKTDDADDSDDICIIENNDASSHDTSTDLKKSTPKKRKPSDDVDCLILYDDKHND